MGAPLLQRVPNPYFGTIPRSSSLGDPTITRAQLLKPYPVLHDGQPLPQQRRAPPATTRSRCKLEQRFSHGLSYLVSYTRSKLMDDASSVFDAQILAGPVANFPVADSFNRRLERDYSTGDIPHVFVASFVWDLPWGSGRRFEPHGLAGALLNDWTLAGIVTLQSGVPIADHAGHQLQRVRRLRHAAAQPGRRSRPCPRRSAPPRAGSTPAPSRWRRSSRWATASRNPVRGPGYRNLDLALISGPRSAAAARRSSFAPRPSTSPTRRRSARPTACSASPGFGTITTRGRSAGRPARPEAHLLRLEPEPHLAPGLR